MNKRVEEVKLGKNNELIWLLEHPTTYSAGVSFNKKDILNRNEDDVDHELRAIAARVCKLLERSLMLDKSPYELFMSEIIN